MSALLAVALLLAQDEVEKKAAAHLAELAGDRVEARDRAVEGLVALGPAALPVLRKRLAGLDPEARVRVEEAVRRIEEAAAIARVLPPLKRVTLALKERPAREALDAIREQTGMTMDWSEAPVDGPVTLALKDAAPLEAMDALCRASGALTYDVIQWKPGEERDRPKGPHVRVDAGRLRGGPAAYVRHYAIQAVSVSQAKSVSFGTDEISAASVGLSVRWPADVRPGLVSDFRLTEVADGKGRSLLLKATERRLRLDESRKSIVRDVEIDHPEADAGRLATVKGRLLFSYPKEVKTLSFPGPAASVGKAQEAGRVRATLTRFERQGGKPWAVWTVSGAPALMGYDRTELVDAEGTCWRGVAGQWREEDELLQSFFAEEAPAAGELRVHVVLSVFEDAVEFELKDVPLPK